ncbi:MAG: NTPase [Candidatus Bathyarchaeia archaeon]
MKRIIFLTGPPRIGKTTVLLKTVEELKKRKITVGGMVTQEIREDGVRVGFKIIDLTNQNEGWLAHVKQIEGPTVGKYKVCLRDLESIGVKAILNASEKADVTVIDEVGPMELFSQAFKESVKEALNSEKTVLGTIHYKARESLITAIKNREDAEIIEVTQNNRDSLPTLIIQKVLELLRRA